MRAHKQGTDIRQAQIAEATLKVVGERGLRGLSVAAVAAEVGLAPSALYRHFPSVNDMLGAAMVLLHQQISETFASLRKETGGPLDVLRDFFFHHAQREPGHIAAGHILFSNVLYTGARELRVQGQAIARDLLARIAGLLREAQGLGTVREDVDAETLALVYIGLPPPHHS